MTTSEYLLNAAAPFGRSGSSSDSASFCSAARGARSGHPMTRAAKSIATEQVESSARRRRQPDSIQGVRRPAWSIYGAQRAQPVATGGKWDDPQKPLKQADPQPVAIRGNRFGAHGKEGVNGSSPLEGFRKFLLISSFRCRQGREQVCHRLPMIPFLGREGVALLASQRDRSREPEDHKARSEL
jgi:hypothetical protein